MITDETVTKQVEDLQKQLAQALDKNRVLEIENHNLRVKVEQYRGKEEAFEFAFDKLVDKLGDR